MKGRLLWSALLVALLVLAAGGSLVRGAGGAYRTLIRKRGRRWSTPAPSLAGSLRRA